MYVILYGGASFPIPQSVQLATLREASRAYAWLRGQYTSVTFYSHA